MRFFLLPILLSLIVNGIRSIYNIEKRFAKKAFIQFIKACDLQRLGKYKYFGHHRASKLHKLFESNDVSENIISLDAKDNLASYLEEIRDLRGTPALVDR